MVLLPRNEVQQGVHSRIPQAAFKNQGSRTVVGAPLTGGSGGDGGRGALAGEYDASVDIISASVSFQFYGPSRKRQSRSTAMNPYS